MNARSSLLVTTIVCMGTIAHAQQPVDDPGHAEMLRVNEEAQAHSAAGRHALAAQRFLELHDLMARAARPRASVALWNAGVELMQVPGREREARDALQRFLDGSTGLAGEQDVAEWRSHAVARIAELEARIGRETRPPARQLETPGGRADAPRGSSSLSPVGPIVLGVGGAALIVAFIVGGFALSEDGTLQSMCPDGRCPTQALLDRASTMRTLAGAADVLLVSGAVVAIVGAILTPLLTESAPEIAPTAACDPHGCVIGVGGRL